MLSLPGCAAPEQSVMIECNAMDARQAIVSGQCAVVCCRRISWQAPAPPPPLSRCLYPHLGWLPQCLSSMHQCLGFWSRQWPMSRLLWVGWPQLLTLRAQAMLCPLGLGRLLRLQRSRGGTAVSISSHRQSRLLMIKGLGPARRQVLLMVPRQPPQQWLLQSSRSRHLHPWQRGRWPALSVNSSDR